MALFLALLPDRAARLRLSRALELDQTRRLKHRVEFADCWAGLQELAEASAPHVAVVDPWATGTLKLDEWSAFHAAFPSVVLFAYGFFDASAGNDLLRLGEIGVRRTACRLCNDEPSVLRLLLVEALACTVIGEVLAGLEDVLPPETVPLVRHLLNAVEDRVRPAELAKLACCSQATLRRHLRAAGLPSTEKLIVWCRLFRAAHLLRGGARTAESVASAVGIASRAALHNELKSYAGITPGELVKRGDLEFLLEQFRRRHRERCWKLG